MSYRNVDPETALLLTRAVLEGTTPSEPDAVVTKMVRIMIGDTDVLVNQQGFFVQYPGRRRPFRYFSGLAPPSFAHIIAAACFDAPIRVAQRRVLDPSKLPKVHLLSTLGPEFHSVWLFPEPDCIRMSVRPGVCDDLTPLKEWTPAHKTYVVLDVSHPCPHCLIEQKRFRELDVVMVCPACGRSFKPSQDLVLDVIERSGEEG